MGGWGGGGAGIITFWYGRLVWTNFEQPVQVKSCHSYRQDADVKSKEAATVGAIDRAALTRVAVLCPIRPVFYGPGESSVPDPETTEELFWNVEKYVGKTFCKHFS